MHYTGTLYRNPYVKESPLLEITQGCTHNNCRFCTMYKDIPFKMSPPAHIEQDIKEIARYDRNSDRIQFVGADPFCLSYEKLEYILNLIHANLPNVTHINMAVRVTNVKNKSVEELKKLKEMGIKELFLGTESGDDWTLNRIRKGYTSEDILEQCAKLDAAGIIYWHTFLNGVAGKSHSMEHAIHTAEVFNQCHPAVVGTGGLTLFPGTPLGEEAKAGEFDPLTEKEMLIELKTFAEHLEIDCSFITHHTISMNLSGSDFLKNKKNIIAALDREINSLDKEDERRLQRFRNNKRSL